MNTANTPLGGNRRKVAILISGGGTTLRNLIEKIENGDLDVHIELVISSNGAAGGLEFATEAGIRTLVIRRADYPTAIAYRDAIFSPCRQQNVGLVVMGGFLKNVLIPPDFLGRVMNIHPSLIPAFCGQGFYGNRVHQAALEYGVKITGCTVHFVDDQYDHGPIIDQRVVTLKDDDSVETLSTRVFEQECNALPAAIQLFADGKLNIEGRRVRIRESPSTSCTPATDRGT